MKPLLLFVFIVCSIGTSNAQVGGESVYNFVNISTSARQSALGGKIFTLVDDINQPLWNPSVINETMDRQLSVNYTSYLTGINMGSVAYAKRLSRRFGTLHANVQYVNYGSFIEADEAGVITGTFNANDVAVSMGYALNLPWTNFYAGTTLKLISSSIGNYTSFGIAADFGLLYRNRFKPYVFTLVLRNLGTQITTYNGVQERLPLELVIGGSYELENVPLKWYVTIDNLQQWNVSVSNPSNQTSDIEGNITNESISFLKNAFRHLIVGAELFPKSAINLRVGYNFRKSQEYKLQNVRTFGGISFGFGLKMRTMKLNYAYSKVHTVSNISTFSLEIDLDSKR